MKNLSTKFMLALLMLSPALLVAQVAAAATITMGNSAISRAATDTYSNFTVVDTNNPAAASGELTSFQYYAANTNPFQFVLVDGSNTVKWASLVITPPSVGAQTYTPVTPVHTNAGWNLGVHFTSTGTIPFDSSGSPASYTPNNWGVAPVGSPLTIEGTSARTYSFGATFAKEDGNTSQEGDKNEHSGGMDKDNEGAQGQGSEHGHSHMNHSHENNSYADNIQGDNEQN